MASIGKILKKYSLKELDLNDLEILLAKAIRKSREFVISHPEYKLTKAEMTKAENYFSKRLNKEPLALIVGRKEFYGIDFIISKHTLIPRPETEMLVEEILKYLKSDFQAVPSVKYDLFDIGVGSGNIVISLTKNIPTDFFPEIDNIFAVDVSRQALEIAERNAKNQNVAEKIHFLSGNLLQPFLKNGIFHPKKEAEISFPKNLIISANLPYLSSKIYNACDKTVKNFEPKTALYSPNKGLYHYNKLLKQLKRLLRSETQNYTVAIFLEFSPEQKELLKKLIKKHFPQAEIIFKKDLANKWRLCEIFIKQ